MAKRLADIGELADVFDTAEVIGCGAKAVRQLVTEGVLEHVRIGRYVRVKRTSIEALIEKGTDLEASRAKAARRRKESMKR
jgi:excisionase family DNA binding protein